MRKKSKNKGLLRFLLFSMLIFVALVAFLQIRAVLSNPEEKNHGEQDAYYLPTVSTKRVTVSYGEEVTPEMFIKSVKSIYEVTYSYERAPDLEKYGTQDVIVLVTDAAGNSAAVKATLNIINLKDKLELNMGEPLPSAEEFLIEEGSEVFYQMDISGIDTTVAGDYSIFLSVDGENLQTILSIDDYEAPTVTTCDVEEWLNHPVPVNRFVQSATDNSTKVELRYKTEPDWSVPGEQQITILASDPKGNTVECNAIVTLYEDTEAPIVSAGNIDVTVGGVVFYRSIVECMDNASPVQELTLTVDNSRVNLNEVGCYDVIYKITDFAGNSTSVEAKVNVVAQAPLWNDADLLYTKAQIILNKILYQGMSNYEKAEAIFNWTHQNIRFINFSEKDNYARGAYEGLFLQEGDCFVYAATAKYLLSMAEVPNLDIKKSSTDPSHYWNLVYINDGWYHFDACPTKEGVKIFLFTDAQLEEFSASRGNSHIYDKSLYPEIK